MGVKTYDAKSVVVVVGGIPLSGYAEDSFVKVSRSDDSFTKYVGADGTVSRAKSNNTSGEITVTLAQTSQSNDVLAALALTDEKTGNGVVPVMIKDLKGTTLHASSAAWVKKPADSEYGKNVKEREWVLDCAELNGLTGGTANT